MPTALPSCLWTITPLPSRFAKGMKPSAKTQTHWRQGYLCTKQALAEVHKKNFPHSAGADVGSANSFFVRKLGQVQRYSTLNEKKNPDLVDGDRTRGLLWRPDVSVLLWFAGVCSAHDRACDGAQLLCILVSPWRTKKVETQCLVHTIIVVLV